MIWFVLVARANKFIEENNISVDLRCFIKKEKDGNKDSNNSSTV